MDKEGPEDAIFHPTSNNNAQNYIINNHVDMEEVVEEISNSVFHVT